MILKIRTHTIQNFRKAPETENRSTQESHTTLPFQKALKTESRTTQETHMILRDLRMTTTSDLSIRETLTILLNQLDLKIKGLTIPERENPSTQPNR
jgi:hypothetical protein